MRNPFYIFRIRREERWVAIIAFLLITTLNALFIYKYFDQFSQISDNYKSIFVHGFHISGYDPITYLIVSYWSAGYNIYRHPLLAFFMYIPNQINQGLMMLTGMNCVQFVVAAILVFCSFYAFIFLYRILREIVVLNRVDSALLAFFFYGFAYIQIASIVPDHFILSMFMLLLVLYVAGRKMQGHYPFTKWETVLCFFITAGISLNNGIKVFLASLFVNGRKFWRPANLVLAVILPSALMWAGARLEWRHFEYPSFHHRMEIKAEKAEKEKQRVIAQYKDTTSLKDTAAINAQIDEILKSKAREKNEKKLKKAVYAHTGKPIAHGEFSQWTDISTPRWESIVENFFGESIQLHRDHLLEDVLTKRPVIVKYRWIGNYVVEAVILLLFLLGIWYGRRSRFFWLAFSFFAFDVLIHIVLGFGINEVYIMSPHYLFVIPIAVAFLIKNLSRKSVLPARLLLSAITLYLYIYNGILLVGYLLS